MNAAATPRGATGIYQCLACKEDFTARVADRKRGWARYCSKSCKAYRQEARTGQHADFQRAKAASESGLCFPSAAEGDVQ